MTTISEILSSTPIPRTDTKQCILKHLDGLGPEFSKRMRELHQLLSTDPETLQRHGLRQSDVLEIASREVKIAPSFIDFLNEARERLPKMALDGMLEKVKTLYGNFKGRSSLALNELRESILNQFPDLNLDSVER